MLLNNIYISTPCLSLIFWVVKMLKQSSKIVYCNKVLGQEMHTIKGTWFQYLVIPQVFMSDNFKPISSYGYLLNRF